MWSVCLMGILPLTPQASVVEMDGADMPTLCALLPPSHVVVRLDPLPFGLAELSMGRVDACMLSSPTVCAVASVRGRSTSTWSECTLQPSASLALTSAWTVGAGLGLTVSGASGFAPHIATEMTLAWMATIDTTWTLASRVTTAHPSVQFACGRVVNANWGMEAGLAITPASDVSVHVAGRYADSLVIVGMALRTAPVACRLSCGIHSSTSFTTSCAISYTAELGIASSFSVVFAAW